MTSRPQDSVLGRRDLLLGGGAVALGGALSGCGVVGDLSDLAGGDPEPITGDRIRQALETAQSELGLEGIGHLQVHPGASSDQVSLRLTHDGTERVVQVSTENEPTFETSGEQRSDEAFDPVPLEDLPYDDLAAGGGIILFTRLASGITILSAPAATTLDGDPLPEHESFLGTEEDLAAILEESFRLTGGELASLEIKTTTMIAQSQAGEYAYSRLAHPGATDPSRPRTTGEPEGLITPSPTAGQPSTAVIPEGLDGAHYAGLLAEQAERKGWSMDDVRYVGLGTVGHADWGIEKTDAFVIATIDQMPAPDQGIVFVDPEIDRVRQEKQSG